MKFKIYFYGLFTVFIAVNAIAQPTSISCSDSLAARIMMGNYNPGAYLATTAINDPNSIVNGVVSHVSPDSLHASLNMLRTFKTRNSCSDTSSNVTGIGAARRWAFSKFQQISAQNEHRLVPSYLQFNLDYCGGGIALHKNVLAVLPGTDTSDKSIVIIEGHLDSRCADNYDTASVAPGIEDNGSGTALVLELARIMSPFSYKRTIVFMLTTGEEQGLFGGLALASYARLHGIKIHGVLNNDVIGGVICGHTSSAPSCPGYEDVDSIHVRLFSYGGFSSLHKGLARFIKLEYKERVLPTATVPMGINIMTPEDRTGRGGDHIPFRQDSFTAMRFTAENEDGDADVTNPLYIDRQHTSSDSIGIDVNNDGVIDSYYVDFDYLARNTVINGSAAGMMGIGPLTPDFTLTTAPGGLIINITAHPEYLSYKVGVRTTTYDWDSVYSFTGTTTGTVWVPTGGNYIVSIASVDSNGVESLFSEEKIATVPDPNSVNAVISMQQIELMQNKPNPADEATTISVLVNENVAFKEAHISICDLNGREVKRTPITLNKGVNEIMYEHGYNMSGTFIYTLLVDGKKVQSKRMVFTN